MVSAGRLRLPMLSNLKGQVSAVMLALAVAMLAAPSPLFAQNINQIELTDQKVTNLIAAQADFAPLASKLAEASEDPDDKLMAELDATAKKHGFSGFDEYRDVDNNIFFVLEGLDPETGEYISEADRLNQESEVIEQDATIPADEKKEMLADIKQEMAQAEALKFPGNVEVVKKHYEALSKLLPEEGAPGPYENDGGSQETDEDPGDSEGAE